jgi:hypothetical protein
MRGIVISEISASDAARWAEPLSVMAEVVRDRTSGSWTVPAWLSQARADVAATSRLPRKDGTAWGEDPVRTAFTVMAMQVAAALEHAESLLVQLVTRAAATLAIDTLARGALEAAAQAWWLVDPAIGGRVRVARLYVVRRRSAQHLEDMAQRMGVTVTAGVGAQVKDIDLHYRDVLGLGEDLGKKGGWKGSEGQEMFDSTGIIASFMRDTGQVPGTGPYAFCSGATHGELWRLAFGYASATAPDGTEVIVPRAPRDFVRTAVCICIDAVMQPAARAMYLLGRNAGLADLRRLQPELRHAMRP